MNSLKTAAPRLLAGFGTLTLLAGLGLFASRPAHTAGGPIAVSVANTPLATTLTDEAAPKEPFQASTTYLIPDGQNAGSLDTLGGYKDIAIPAGKRLIIQAASAYEGYAAGQNLHAFVLTNVNGNFGYYALPSLLDDGTGFSGVTQPMTLATDAGTLYFTVYRKGTVGDTYVSFTVYGYLVNV